MFQVFNENVAAEGVRNEGTLLGDEFQRDNFHASKITDFFLLFSYLFLLWFSVLLGIILTRMTSLMHDQIKQPTHAEETYVSIPR